jgi:hypothetical protein
VRSFSSRIQTFLEPHLKILAGSIALLLMLNVMVMVKDSTASSPHGGSPVAAGAPSGAAAGNGANPGSSAPGVASSSGALAGNGGGKGSISKLAKYKPGVYIPGVGTVPYGIDFKTKTIKLVYYWKGNRDTSGAAGSLGSSGQQGALDEADAFRRFVSYVNKHANDPVTRSCTTPTTSCFMGVPFNLHGFHIDEKCLEVKGDCIIEAGESQSGWNEAAQKAVGLEPLAAISSHGGLSDNACPILADAKIFNPVTYNLYPGLLEKTHGYCLPAGMAWEKQVNLTIPWLQKQNPTQYCETPATCKERKYGILFAEYPGEAGAVQGFVRQLLAAGINLAKSKSTSGYSVYSVSTSLTTAGTQQGSVVQKFVNDGVNTILAPDAGAPITFTHAAEGAHYFPDYYVWPCSGEDAEGQVRLYDPHQWTRATGLSCYDEQWRLDLTLDTNARSTQWFRQYREIACPGNPNCTVDPPATSPLVYMGLMPVLVGLTAAGADITREKFFAGIANAEHYRYNAITGPTTNPSNFLLTLGDKEDGSQIGDVAKVAWNSAKRTDGNSTPGSYDYSQTRYKSGDKF